MQAGQKWSELDQMTRAELEQDCDFLGLIIMQVINLRQALEFLFIRQLLKILKKNHHACTQSFQLILKQVLRLSSCLIIRLCLEGGRQSKLEMDNQTIIHPQNLLKKETFGAIAELHQVIRQSGSTDIYGAHKIKH